MALNYDFTKIENFKELHEEQAEFSKSDTLVWMCLAVGLNGITAENYGEFYARVKMIEKLSGAMAHTQKGDYFFTVEDIKRRIGLKTNVSNTTQLQFIKNKANSFLNTEKHYAESQNNE